MENGETITLRFLRDDGKEERVYLAHHSLSEAREVAENVLGRGAGLYIQVKLSKAGRLIEIIDHTFA